MHFSLSQSGECKNFTENTSSSNSSKYITFFKVLSDNKISTEERLMKIIIIDYFQRGKALRKERITNAKREIPFL